MLNYILMRLLRMIPQMLIISVLAWVIIQLPPGDFLTEQINRLKASGLTVDNAEVERLTKMYGLDQPYCDPVLEMDHRISSPRVILVIPSPLPSP